jgi:hypothetical protein
MQDWIICLSTDTTLPGSRGRCHGVKPYWMSESGRKKKSRTFSGAAGCAGKRRGGRKN